MKVCVWGGIGVCHIHFLSKLGVGHVSLSSEEGGGGGGVDCFDRMSRISNQVKKIRNKFKIENK